MLSRRRELTLAVIKRAGEGEAGSFGTGRALKERCSRGWAVGNGESECDKKRRLLELDGAWLRDLWK